MNREHLGGLWKILTGAAVEACGALCGQPRQKRRGFERRISGHAQMAIGDAQRLLAACRRPDKKHAVPLPPSSLRDMPLRAEPDDSAHLAGLL